jgi:glycosyltransferase 2 family protein
MLRRRASGDFAMNPRLKKALLFAFKAIVLVAVIEYARRQLQLEDELGAVSNVVVSTEAHRPLQVTAGTRLKILEAPGAGRARAYRALAPRAEVVSVPASDVDGKAHAFELLPGLKSTLRHVDLPRLALALLAFGPAIFLMSVRWQMLLRMSRVVVPFGTIVRLHYMGFFFNMFMPGGLGGDLVKAVYVTGYSPRKAEAATMVLVDRVIGLVGLLLMAGTVILLDYSHLGGIALQVGALSLALAIGAFLFFSSKFRALIRYERLIAGLPGSGVLKRIDTVLYELQGHGRVLLLALGLTVFVQLVEVLGVSLAGGALGIVKAEPRHYLVFVPVGYLFNALPISFGGIGVMEGAYMEMFKSAGVATASQGFMLGVVARLLVIFWSLPGALCALWPPEKPAAGAGPADRQPVVG